MLTYWPVLWISEAAQRRVWKWSSDLASGDLQHRVKYDTSGVPPGKKYRLFRGPIFLWIANRSKFSEIFWDCIIIYHINVLITKFREKYFRKSLKFAKIKFYVWKINRLYGMACLWGCCIDSISADLSCRLLSAFCAGLRRMQPESGSEPLCASLHLYQRKHTSLFVLLTSSPLVC